MRRSAQIKGIAIAILLTIVLCISYAAWHEDRRGLLTVSFLNIGQGDSIFIDAIGAASAHRRRTQFRYLARAFEGHAVVRPLHRRRYSHTSGCRPCQWTYRRARPLQDLDRRSFKRAG